MGAHEPAKVRHGHIPGIKADAISEHPDAYVVVVVHTLIVSHARTGRKSIPT
jgi:hypothetical protein